jgi:hypothetical protein
MKRSAHVTIAAIVMLIASILFVAAFSVGLINFGRELFDISWRWLKVALGIYCLVFLALGFWGIASAIGLLRQRRWGRISAVWLSALVLMSPVLLLGSWDLLIVFVSRKEAGFGFESPHAVVGWNLLWLLLPVWWLILFTRPRVKRQFARPQIVSDAVVESSAGGAA